jgi:hypothetical protein
VLSCKQVQQFDSAKCSSSGHGSRPKCQSGHRKPAGMAGSAAALRPGRCREMVTSVRDCDMTMELEESGAWYGTMVCLRGACMGFSRCQQRSHTQARFYGVHRLLWRSRHVSIAFTGGHVPRQHLAVFDTSIVLSNKRALILHHLAVRCISIISFVRRVYVPMQIARNCKAP